MFEHTPPKQETAWRDDPYLVLRLSGAEFPLFCIICNEPAEKCYKLKLRDKENKWRRDLAISLLTGFMLPIGHKATLESFGDVSFKPAICHAHLQEVKMQQRRALATALNGCMAVAIAYAFFEPLANTLHESIPYLLALLGAATIIVGGVISRRPWRLRAKKVDRHFGWIEGVCPEYLEHFPYPPHE
jgi:hypothetical protein